MTGGGCRSRNLAVEVEKGESESGSGGRGKGPGERREKAALGSVSRTRGRDQSAARLKRRGICAGRGNRNGIVRWTTR